MNWTAPYRSFSPLSQGISVYIYETTTIVLYSGDSVVGIAKVQEGGAWECRSLVDPMNLKIETTVVDTERKAVRRLKQNRYGHRIKKIRLPRKLTNEDVQ